MNDQLLKSEIQKEGVEMKTQKTFMFLAILATAVFASSSFAMNTWVKTYGDGGWQRYHQAYQTSEGGSLIVGTAQSGVNEGGFAMKINSEGTLLWKKRYGINNGYTLFSGCETDDSYLLAGKSINSKGLIIKVNPVDGSILWSREYEGIGTIYTIKPLSGGGFVIAGWYSTGSLQSSPKYHVVMKLNPSLEPVWRTAIRESANKIRVDTVFELAGGDFICLLPYTGVIARLNGDTGDVDWINTYKEGTTKVQIAGITPVGNQFAVAAIENSIVVFMINSDGSLATSPNAVKIDGGDTESPTSITAASDGGFLLSGLWTSNSTVPYSKVLLFKLDSQFGIQWQKQLSDGVHKFEPESNIREYAGEVYYSGSYQPDPSVSTNRPVVFAKLNPDGDAGVGCGFLSDLSLTAQSITLATPLLTSLTVDRTDYDTNGITVPVNNMTNIAENSSCEETYPTLAIYLDPNQGRVEGTLYGQSELIINCGGGQDDCVEIVDYLSMLQLATYPKAGYAFSHWEYEGLQTTSNPVSVVVSGDTEWEAVFEEFRLQFPVDGYTSTTVPISAVMDHSLSGGYYTPDGRNGEVKAFNGLIANGTEHVYSGNVYCYDVAGTNPFPGLNYIYIDEEHERSEICYDEHPGFDFAIATGTDILAPADGKLRWASTDPINGNVSGFHTFYIDHENGYTTWFLHCSGLTQDVLTEIQQNGFAEVEAGDHVAESGSAGTTAAHLHFEVRLNGIDDEHVIDPYGEELWE